MLALASEKVVKTTSNAVTDTKEINCLTFKSFMNEKSVIECINNKIPMQSLSSNPHTNIILGMFCTISSMADEATPALNMVLF